MNIFVLDADPNECVRHYCDKHVSKMLLETAQLLCSAHHAVYNSIEKKGLDVSGAREQIPYKATHVNHPCAQWTRGSVGNYVWLLNLGFALSGEFYKRFGKMHKSTEVIMWAHKHRVRLPDGMLTPWPQVMPDEYKVKFIPSVNNRYGCAVKAYRKYYAAKLKDFRKRGMAKKARSLPASTGNS